MPIQETEPNSFRDSGSDTGLVKTPDGRVVPAHSELEHNLATNIKYQRERRGLSQSLLAKKMEEAGFAWYQTTVSRVEALERPVQVAEAYALAKIFGLPLEALVGPTGRQKLVDDLTDAYQKVLDKVEGLYKDARGLFAAQADLHEILSRAQEAGIKAHRVDANGRVGGEEEELTVLAGKVLKARPERAVEAAREDYIKKVEKQQEGESKPPDRRREGPQHRKTKR